MGAVLTLNAGSSSLKFALYPAGQERPCLEGEVDHVGGAAELCLPGESPRKLPGDLAAQSHDGAVRAVLDLLKDRAGDAVISAVGHRIVHGGPDLAAPVLLDEALLARLDRLSPFAPLHQPHNLDGVRAARAAFPGVPQVGCFDTAFHRNQPFAEDCFALPRAYFDAGVRRYGFHGLSYDYISGHLAETEPELAAGRVIVAHLGNGASACAIRGGVSVASTMGLSALDGLPMGTRCGQIDPGVLLYLMQDQGMDAAEISDLLYTKSGLLGLSGLSNDLRELEAADSPAADQAIEVFTHRIRREIASLAAVLEGCDALVFTAGIGEHSARVRADVCSGMGWMGVTLDAAANAAHAREISAPGARLRVMVIPTDEEGVIARAARAHVALKQSA